MCSIYIVFSISLLLGFEGGFTFFNAFRNTPSLKVRLLGLPRLLTDQETWTHPLHRVRIPLLLDHGGEIT